MVNYIAIIFVLCIIFDINCALDLNHLRYYESIKLRQIDVNSQTRTRRDVTITDKQKHPDETEFRFSGHGRDFHLYVYKNTFLLAYDEMKNTTINNQQHTNCYYHGFLTNRYIDLSDSRISFL